MRLASLAALSLCATTLTAQSFTEEQRAELRNIIREEIQNAVKDLHKGGAPMWVTSMPGAPAAHGEAPKQKEAVQWQFHLEGNDKTTDKAAGGKGEVLELVDVTEDEAKPTKKTKTVKMMTVDDAHQGLHELKLDGMKIDLQGEKGVHVFHVSPEGNTKKGEAMVLQLEGGQIAKLLEGDSIAKLVEGKLLEGKLLEGKLLEGKLLEGKDIVSMVHGVPMTLHGGKTAMITLEGGKECCEHECGSTCTEAKEKECCEEAEKCEAAEKSECCEGGEKADCCEVVIHGGHKAEKKTKKSKKAKKAKKAKAAKAVPAGALEFSIEGELPAAIQKIVESSLREIH